MQKSIKKKELNQFIGPDGALTAINYKVKNIFTIRCEKLLKKINELGIEVNNEIQDIREEFASTDKESGNFIYETVTVTDSKGNSKTENTGSFKYTHERAKQRDEKIERLFQEEVKIPVNIISRDNNLPLYKQIFKEYTLTTISKLAGVLLDVPVDDEGFVQEEFIIKFTEENQKSEDNKNVQAKNSEIRQVIEIDSPSN